MTIAYLIISLLATLAATFVTVLAVDLSPRAPREAYMRQHLACIAIFLWLAAGYCLFRVVEGWVG